jgi:hypothetical protein
VRRSAPPVVHVAGQTRSLARRGSQD